MTPERWQQIETLFHSALARTGDERESFLDSACAHDQELRREVEALLASHDEAGSFIQSPALDLMAEEMANDQARALAGRLINHYKILSQLGAGGMGEVYLAQESKTGRRVALKLLPEHFTSDGERVRRFQQEAHAVLALNHPNILTIYEIGEAGGSYYIATEFIDGETLRAHMARAPVKLEEALDVAAQVASALTEAHAAGIVHRDIKPENIMIRRDGYVKVLDFGIAKLTERQQPLTTAEAPTRLKVKTDPGMVMGTVAYMSPEQARGASVDERTDIWSLGCVLYEMIAGRVPFEGESAGDTISMILDKQPPTLARYAPESPQEIQWVVNRALRKNKEERYQTVKELLGDLRELKQELEVQARIERSTSPEADAEAIAAAGGARLPVMTATAAPARSDGADVRTTSSAEYLIDGIRRHKRGFAIATLMVLLVAAVGVGYWFFVRHSSNASQIQSIAVLPFVNASGNPDVEYLSDGMTESLINNLSQLPKLSVKARSSVFRYKGREVEPQQIAGELSVQAVLNGRVVQHGDNLSLSLELVDARNGNLIWGEQYNRKLTDLVSLQ
ncbi:MAG TPA: serine/threonine-protein kinase, partial [Pyrinomonadaceae bacterium]|nr:serine/threonine-protein kinase [Pyrinomonadaceae bacterium]